MKRRDNAPAGGQWCNSTDNGRHRAGIGAGARSSEAVVVKTVVITIKELVDNNIRQEYCGVCGTALKLI
ncbi:hypothetical protein EVAR_81076_1 [Eumeta japonica]|uniref:Uncharacterized protein n=1 Tax=Eumeta variegata TaxID=151549 RepID=A0A4C1T6P0_EUMVA|nr:hypothetical protein EVAR_81076_1 [Eumeta japonica]